jgi:outer membrane biosynthesis protein TonB
VTRLWTALGALLLVTAPVSAQVARSPVGIEVDVPQGWRARAELPRPANVIYLESTEAGPNPGVIFVNHIIGGSDTREEKLFAEARSMAADPKDAQEVTLRSGKFMRVDFDVPMKTPARTVRQRIYVTLRGNRIYTFNLSNLEADRRAAHLPAFDAMVDGARFFEPERSPSADAAKPPEPAKPEPAKPEPGKPPEPAKPEPVKPDAAKPPEPAKPEPAKPDAAKPPEPVKPEPAKPELAKPDAAKPDAAKPPEPAKPDAPKDPARPRPPAPPRNLLAGAKLVRFDTEYDPDVWAASHLVDAAGARRPAPRGRSASCWRCPRPAGSSG